MRHVFGWAYPPGAENDPNAPYNQPEMDSELCECGSPKIEGASMCEECFEAEAADAAYDAMMERDWD